MSQALNFPARIYQILEHENSDIIQWNSNGLSFRIVDHIRFEAEIIPKYFRHRKISSVQRQLNVYGFRSISRGEHKRSFYHPLFKRGNWEVVKQMARYVPPKGGVGDVDPEHIESAIPCAASVKVERDPEIRVPIKAEAAHWASGTQSNLSKKFFNPSYPQPSSSSVCIRGSGSAVNQPLRNGGNQSMGKVQINQPNDAVDNHFSNDFYETSAVGTEANHVTIQPVDYSIPMLFQQTARTTAPAAVSSGTAGAVASLSVADGNYERAEGTSSNCTPSVQVSDDDLLFDPDSECFDQLLDSLEAPYNIGGNGAPSSSCHVPLYMASRGVVAGAVEDQPSLFAAQFERFRSDSLDDVYALCADLF